METAAFERLGSPKLNTQYILRLSATPTTQKKHRETTELSEQVRERMRVSSNPTQQLWLHDMNSSVHLHHISISPNPCAPKSSFSCSMPRPPNRNRRIRHSRNPSLPTTVVITTTKPYFHPSSSPSQPDTPQATFDLHYLYHASHHSLQQCLSSASDALQELWAVVSVGADNRVLVSCRPSTLRFVTNLVVLTFAVVLGFRVLVGLVRLGFRGRSRYGREGTVVKRDRSLGGKEVVVGSAEKARVDVRKKKSFGMLDNPLSVPKRTVVDGLERLLNIGVRVWEKKKLPRWWPSCLPRPSLVVDKDYYQSEADRLVRGQFVGSLPSVSILVFI